MCNQSVNQFYLFIFSSHYDETSILRMIIFEFRFPVYVFGKLTYSISWMKLTEKHTLHHSVICHWYCFVYLIVLVRGRYCMVVWLTTTCAISVYGRKFESRPWRGVLDTTLCGKICQLLASGRWFPPGTPVFSTNKTDRHDIAEILLKVALNPITPPPPKHIIIKYYTFVSIIGSYYVQSLSTSFTSIFLTLNFIVPFMHLLSYFPLVVNTITLTPLSECVILYCAKIFKSFNKLTEASYHVTRSWLNK